MNLFDRILSAIFWYTLEYILGFQEMFNKRVQRDPSLLKFVPARFRMHCLKVVEKRKAQKAKLKEELMRVAWHPSRWWDSCVPENEKKETKKLWS